MSCEWWPTRSRAEVAADPLERTLSGRSANLRFPMRAALRRSLPAAAAFALGLAAAPAAGAALSGVVFEDLDRNGVRGRGEPGISGVAVSNGRELVRTDANGRYSLPETGRFVAITRPVGFDAAPWARRGGGDFALTARPVSDEFFFVQISDAHVYDRRDDFFEFSSIFPSWFPEWLSSRLLLWLMPGRYPEHTRETLVDGFRSALRSGAAPDQLSDSEAIAAYLREFARPGSALGDVERSIRAAFEEVSALQPAFVISTGDLVLEGNQGSPEAVERWFRFYTALTADAGLTFYNTLGNNELAGTENEEFPSDDPRFGKHYFREFHGPTHFSFDRGAFHFAATDTHRPEPDWLDGDAWTFERMEPHVRDWLDADLEEHAGKTLVVLNHEPFYFQEDWGFDYEPADDEGLFARHRVSYVLSGHVHQNGFARLGETTHITTGALSGLRWVVPASVHPRGYRLFYARGGQLVHAWKQIGRVLLALAQGDGDGSRELVVAAADVAGPFASIEVSAGGQRVALERWGDYFARLKADLHRAASERLELEIVGIRADGSRVSAVLSVGE